MRQCRILSMGFVKFHIVDQVKSGCIGTRLTIWRVACVGTLSLDVDEPLFG